MKSARRTLPWRGSARLEVTAEVDDVLEEEDRVLTVRECIHISFKVTLFQ
jgi:hypothetical protein